MTQNSTGDLSQKDRSYPHIPFEVVYLAQDQMNNLLSSQINQQYLPVVVPKEVPVRYDDIEIIDAEVVPDYDYDTQDNEVIETVGLVVVTVFQLSGQAVVFLVKHVAIMAYWAVGGLLYCVIELVRSLSSPSCSDHYFDDRPVRRSRPKVNVETNVWVTGDADVNIKTNVHVKN